MPKPQAWNIHRSVFIIYLESSVSLLYRHLNWVAFKLRDIYRFKLGEENERTHL